MAQEIKRHIKIQKRWVEQFSADRFVFFYKVLPLFFIFLFGQIACGEPKIKLDRAARRTIDTLVNEQLDSISPVLDSLCTTSKDSLIQLAVDSIIEERRKKEERLRINGGD